MSKLIPKNNKLEDNEVIPKNNKYNYFNGVFSFLNPIADSYINSKVENIFGDMPISEIRKRLYNNLYPYGYNNIEKRLKTVVKENKKDPDIDKCPFRNVRDDIFAEYLQIPKKDRRNINYDVVVPSKYSPARSGNNNNNYYTLKNMTGSKFFKKYLIQSADGTVGDINHNRLSIGENKLSKVLKNWFGVHTLGRGLDKDKGEYISWYDKWDLAPLKGKGQDESLGIGKPIEFYDRLYLDDYYGVNSAPKKGDYYGGYLPEVKITLSKKGL